MMAVELGKLDSKQTVAELISEIRAKNIKLWVEGDSLRYKAPKGALTNMLLQCLAEHKQEIIKYLQASNDHSIFFKPIPRAEERVSYPLSAPQRMMYLLNQLNEESTAYNLTQVLKISGELDKERLIWVIEQLIGRHESLRTSFELIEGEPRQKIHSKIDFQLEYDEITGETDRIEELILEFIRPYDLSRPPLFRFKLVKVESPPTAPYYLLVQDMHHIISDGVSGPILVSEVNQLYAGKSLPPLKVQYKDYTVWHENLLASYLVQVEKDFWIRQLQGELPLLNLPTDYPRPASFTFKGDTLKLRINQELTQDLTGVARDNKVTLFTVLLAAYYLLLSRYTGQNEIIIGTPTAGRRHSDLFNLIGVFVNTLALRNTIRPEMTRSQFIRELGDNVLRAFDNQDYPFEELVEVLQVPRDLSRNPVFDAMFILQNMEIKEVKAEGLDISRYEFYPKMAQVDLTLIATENGDGIDLEINYCTDLFKQETISRLGGHYLNILREMASAPQEKLATVNLLAAVEKNQILHSFNDTAVEYKRGKTIHQLFEEQVAKTPDYTALILGNERMSYRELNVKANQLAGKLIEKGVQPGAIIGVMTKRSFEMLISIIAVLKAGGAYLPIDPEYPVKRIQYMLDDCKAQLLITQKGSGGDIRFEGQIIDVTDERLFQGSTANHESISTPRDLAYVIYTSGSTGKPKGVMLEHQSVNNFFEGMSEKIDFKPGKTILALTTLSFDIFVLETLLPLSKGMTVVIATEDQQKDPAGIEELIIKNAVDMLQATPSRMKLLFSMDGNQICLKGLREIMIGGEPFPGDLLSELQQLTTAKIYNLYGPTETTVWSAVKELTHENKITIGRPIANTRIYIVDPDYNLQPVGVVGELCIAGEGLARGYYNRKELTEEKFVANPFVPGERMYRTGDLAKWLPDGEIECLGRHDQQVKIRGFRIELSEIENKLTKHALIREAVVVVREERQESKSLWAYLVAGPGLVVSEIRKYLADELPDYMIPSHFIQLEQLPLTPNGKVNRQALMESGSSLETGVEHVPPSSQMEKEIAKVWSSVLGATTISIHDNFFDLGGNSLKAVQILSKLHHYQIEFRDLLQHPTIAQLSKYIEGSNHSPQKTRVFSEQVRLGPEDDPRLTAEYYLKPDGSTVPYLTILSCQDAVLNLIYQNKTGVETPCELFLNYLDFRLVLDSQEVIRDIEFRERVFNEGFFKVKQFSGKGRDGLAEIEALLDQGEIVIIQTFTERLPFYLHFKGFDAPEELLLLGHIFLAVGHDRDHLYFVEAPWNINQKNYLPLEYNHSIGVIPKEQLEPAFSHFVNYAVISIDESRAPDTVRAVAMITEVINSFLAVYHRKVADHDGLQVYYGKVALEKLISICGQGYLHLNQIVTGSGKLSLHRLLVWKFWEIVHLRKLFHRCLCKFAAYFNQENLNKTLSVLEANIQAWEGIIHTIEDRHYRKQYMVDTHFQTGFKEIAELEEKLAELLQSVVNW